MSEISDEDTPDIVILIGDTLQLSGDLFVSLLEKSVEETEKIKEIIVASEFTTITGNIFQTLGAFLDGIFKGEFRITHILTICGNILQAIGGIIEALTG